MITKKGVAGFTILLALCVIVFGAYVRLTDAGLGCPDWPGCYGFITVPEPTEDYLSVEENFPGEIVDEGKAWSDRVAIARSKGQKNIARKKLHKRNEGSRTRYRTTKESMTIRKTWDPL